MINAVISWTISLAGVAVLLIPPILVHRFAKRLFPLRRGLLTGAAIGLVIVPLSAWLYAQYFTDPVRALVLGFPGMFLLMLHVGPFASFEGVSHAIVGTDSGIFSGLGILWVECTLLWVPIYALLGALYDRFVASRSQWRLGRHPADGGRPGGRAD